MILMNCRFRRSVVMKNVVPRRQGYYLSVAFNRFPKTYDSQYASLLLDIYREPLWFVVEIGYLQAFCQTLIEELDRIPGDSRLQIGFVTYDSSLHFYNLAAELTQPHMFVAPDLEGKQ